MKNIKFILAFAIPLLVVSIAAYFRGTYDSKKVENGKYIAVEELEVYEKGKLNTSEDILFYNGKDSADTGRPFILVSDPVLAKEFQDSKGEEDYFIEITSKKERSFFAWTFIVIYDIILIICLFAIIFTILLIAFDKYKFTENEDVLKENKLTNKTEPEEENSVIN